MMFTTQFSDRKKIWVQNNLTPQNNVPECLSQLQAWDILKSNGKESVHRKSCMQRLQVAYNFGCRALYNLSWRASVSSHQVQCNIPTVEALLRKYTYLFLKRCRKSKYVWLRALMQSDCLYSSLFFDHYNRILLCE